MLNINQTGLQTDEYIIGTLSSSEGKKGNLGTIIQVKFPENRFMNPNMEYITSKTELMIRDEPLGYIKTIDKKDRMKWIKENSNDKIHFIHDIPNVMIRFIALGGEFLKLDNNDQVLLSAGDWISIEKVCDMFPKKPGSNAKFHTLIFRGTIWSIKEINKNVKYDLIYDIINSKYIDLKLVNKDNKDKDIKLINVNNLNIGLYDDKPLNTYPTFYPKIENELKWLTPGILKSLLQKCIRFNAKHVIINNVKYITKQVIITVFILLMNNPGSFVPDLNTFVRGSESALKRLAVCIMEDTCCNKYKTHDIVQTLLFAALAGKNNEKFSLKFIEKCVDVIEDVLENNFSIYDMNVIINGSKNVLTNKNDIILLETLKTLKSFEMDYNLVISCIENKWKTEKGLYKQPDEMQIYHCIDQHCASSVLYCYYDKNNLYINPTKMVEIFWNESSSINHRKMQVKINNNVELAQHRYW